jgi:hypothetical protein
VATKTEFARSTVHHAFSHGIDQLDRDLGPIDLKRLKPFEQRLGEKFANGGLYVLSANIPIRAREWIRQLDRQFTG